MARFLATGFMMTICLWAAAPLQAQGMDDNIKSLEEKISRLKAEQQQVKAEQIELKGEATAAAALPIFTYRTGFLGITAADKSWQFC